jgi:hypothetical protein
VQTWGGPDLDGAGTQSASWVLDERDVVSDNISELGVPWERGGSVGGARQGHSRSSADGCYSTANSC